MKIFINLEPPGNKENWGGGLFFVKNFANFLKEKGHQVTYNLETGIDILFIIDPREGSYRKYGLEKIIRYKKRNPKSKIIHRVNECNIKKKNFDIDNLLIKTMNHSDKVIFLSKWLMDYFKNKYKIQDDKFYYVVNGCDKSNFYPIENKIFDKDKIKLVTHHWSSNYLKGFEIYNKLDELLPEYPNIEFTFIGNYNQDYKPKNIKLVPPVDRKELGNLLRKQDIYVTASVNEPGGMHYLEGLASGLPILCREGGGGINEVGEKYGKNYKSVEDFFYTLDDLSENYETYRKNLDYRFFSSERCSQMYYNIIFNMA